MKEKYRKTNNVWDKTVVTRTNKLCVKTCSGWKCVAAIPQLFWAAPSLLAAGHETGARARCSGISSCLLKILVTWAGKRRAPFVATDKPGFAELRLTCAMIILHLRGQGRAKDVLSLFSKYYLADKTAWSEINTFPVCGRSCGGRRVQHKC